MPGLWDNHVHFGGGEALIDENRRLLPLYIAHGVTAVRGLGLWAGVELVPSAGGARPYCYKLKDRGLLCKDTHTHTIRLAPPLVITKEQLDWAVDQIEAVLAS